MRKFTGVFTVVTVVAMNFSSNPDVRVHGSFINATDVGTVATNFQRKAI